MNSNILKSGFWWLLKAAILVSLSAVAIFLSAPKAEAAVLTGDMITSGGLPVVKIDEVSTVSFTDATVAQRFWGNVGNQVKVDCVVRNSTMFNLKSVTLTSTGEKVWLDNSVVSGDQTDQGGGLIVAPLDKIQGRLIVRHTRLTVDTTPALVYGSYNEVALDGLRAELQADLFKLANTYGADIIAEGELNGLVMLVDNLWINGVQRKQLGFVPVS